VTQSFVSIDELSIRSGFWAVAGGLVLVEAKQVRKGKKPRRDATTAPITPPAFARIIGAGVVLIGIVAGSVMWWADAQVHDATRSAAQDAEGTLRSAIGVWPLLDYKRGLATLLAKQEEADETEDQGLQREVDDAFTYLDRFPIPIDMVTYARTLEERGDLEGARELLEDAVKFDPHNLVIRNALHGLEEAE
jgi:hypothetical protein